METVYCLITKKDVPSAECYKGSDIRKPILQLIQQEHPQFTEDNFISVDVLNEYRKRYITQLITEEYGEVSQLEEEVIHAVQTNKILAENIEEDIDEHTTFGQR